MGRWRYTEAAPRPEAAGDLSKEGFVRHIGVDLSKRAFTACFLEADDSHCLATYSMTPEGIAAFREQLHPDDQLAFEVGTNAYYFHDQSTGRWPRSSW